MHKLVDMMFFRADLWDFKSEYKVKVRYADWQKFEAFKVLGICLFI